MGSHLTILFQCIADTGGIQFSWPFYKRMFNLKFLTAESLVSLFLALQLGGKVWHGWNDIVSTGCMYHDAPTPAAVNTPIAPLSKNSCIFLQCSLVHCSSSVIPLHQIVTQLWHFFPLFQQIISFHMPACRYCTYKRWNLHDVWPNPKENTAGTTDHEGPNVKSI